MGFSAGHCKEMMKIIAIALLAAVAFVEPRPSPGDGARAEPKADADPYLLYGGYGLGHYGYAGYYGYPYGGYAYYGKRSAEPVKADADPYLLYGGYDMDTLDTVDTMGTHMVDLPTMDKLFPLNRQPTILVFFISDHIFSA